MIAKTLGELEASIAQLNLQDQVRLLQYLTPRIACAVLARGSNAPGNEAGEPWQRFRTLGGQLAATSVPGAASLTDAVSQMRR